MSDYHNANTSLRLSCRWVSTVLRLILALPFLLCCVSELNCWAGEKSVTTPTNAGSQPATPLADSENEGKPRSRPGPIFVPMDSWVYDALDRIASLGFVIDQAAGMRPWTREECMRQINEAQRLLSSDFGARRPVSAAEAQRLVSNLREELAKDGDFRNYIELESLYARYLGIGGKPLIINGSAVYTGDALLPALRARRQGNRPRRPVSIQVHLNRRRIKHLCRALYRDF